MTGPTRQETGKTVRLLVQTVCDDPDHAWHSQDCGPDLEQISDNTRPAFPSEIIEVARELGYAVIERDKIKHCPMCGRLVNRQRYDDEMCLPSNCDAWVVHARFNHATREWDPIEGTDQ